LFSTFATSRIAELNRWRLTKHFKKDAVMDIPEWLLSEAFRIEHNPNCPSPFLVRLVGRGSGYIRGNSDDVCGYVSTPIEF
jgi:hypothetical protein